MYWSRQYLSMTQKKVCHAHFNAHEPTKPVAPTIFMLETAQTCDGHSFMLDKNF